MKLGIGIWIAFLAGFVGFAVAIKSVLQIGNPLGIYMAAGLLFIFGLVFFIIYKFVVSPSLFTSRLEKIGVPGKATITAVQDTGVTINQNPQAKLIVEIKNTLGQTYTTTVLAMVSRLYPNMYEPGMVIPVKIDPNNEKNAILDTSKKIESPPPPKPSEAQNAAFTIEMTKMQLEQTEIRNSGVSARAIIKAYNWFGINVNGNNPYVELELEILPDDKPAFQGKTKCVIAELNVSKYQPGQQVTVKYDLNDSSKIVVMPS